jgi:glycosyltransferase domain-containing protein
MGLSSTNPRLTFLLPVRGRLLHPLRLLWHSNRTKNPYRFLVADGTGDPTFTAVLGRSSDLFPNLDIEHVVYPDDGSFQAFYRRTAAAARRVSTPYVMNVGDDDFVLAAGAEHCIRFMDQSLDYVSCGGGVAGFSLASASSPDELPVIGSITRIKYPHSRAYVTRDLDKDVATDRIMWGLSNY